MYNSEQEQDQIAAAFDFLAVVYDKSIDIKQIDAYVSVFASAGLTAQDIEDGAHRHAANTERAGQFFPKPSDIINQVKGDNKVSSTRAWLKVLEVKRKGGLSSNRRVVFDDPKINYTINSLGGMTVINTADAEGLEKIRWNFEAYYNAARGNESGSDSCKPTGDEIHKTLLIGNQDKCVALLTAKRAPAIDGPDLVKQIASKKSVR